MKFYQEKADNQTSKKQSKKSEKVKNKILKFIIHLSIKNVRTSLS